MSRNPRPKSEIRNPKSKIQNPKSEIQNPKSKIRNPKSKIPRQNPKFGWGPHKKNCYITIQNPKSKIPKIRPKSLDFGFWVGDFWILDSGFWTADFGFWGGPGDVPLGNSVTVPGRQRLESLWSASAKPTLSDIVRAREQIELQKPRAQEVKTIFHTFLHDF